MPQDNEWRALARTIAAKREVHSIKRWENEGLETAAALPSVPEDDLLAKAAEKLHLAADAPSEASSWQVVLHSTGSGGSRGKPTRTATVTAGPKDTVAQFWARTLTQDAFADLPDREKLALVHRGRVMANREATLGYYGLRPGAPVFIVFMSDGETPLKTEAAKAAPPGKTLATQKPGGPVELPDSVWRQPHGELCTWIRAHATNGPDDAAVAELVAAWRKACESR